MNTTGEEPIRSLIVEDEELLAMTTGASVERAVGGTVQTVGSAEEAQKAWQENQHEFIVLDINLPGQSGHEFCQWLRQQEKGENPFVLFSTGENTTESFQKALASGANDYVVKSMPPKLFEVRLAIAKAQVIQTRRRLELAAEVQRNEERFRLISENSRDLVCTHSPDGTLTYISPSCINLLGREPEELIGRKFDDIKKNQNEETINLGWESDEANGQLETTTVWETSHKDGSQIWLETYSQGTRNKAGEVTEIYSYSRDVTEEKREENSLEILQILGSENDAQSFIEAVMLEMEEKIDASVCLHIHGRPGLGEQIIAGPRANQAKELHKGVNHNTPPEKSIFQGKGASALFNEIETTQELETIITEPVLNSLGKPLGKITICREKKTPESGRLKFILSLTANKIGCVLEEHATR
jgi:PAS domain S-box-containing protein